MAETTPTNEAGERLRLLLTELGNHGEVFAYETAQELVGVLDAALASEYQRGRPSVGMLAEAMHSTYRTGCSSHALEECDSGFGFEVWAEKVHDWLDAIAAEHREDGARIRDFNERRAAMGLPALSEDEAGELLASNIAEHREGARP